MNYGGLLYSLDEIKDEITRQKHLHGNLIKEQETISKTNMDREHMAEEFRDRILKTTKTVEQHKGKHMAAMDSKKAEAYCLHQEQAELQEQLIMVDRAIKVQEAKHAEVEKAANVVALLPKREVVFKGCPRSAVTPHTFDVKTHISYPMEGGTALITFENDIVAQAIRSVRSHKVTLEKECYITVEPHPIQLLVPTSVQLDTRVCPSSILVSQLPSLDSEAILDKLELHFSKSLNGGGEVVDRDLREDAGNAVLVFKDDHIVAGLVAKQFHEVQFQGKKKKHKVRVTPFVNGTISHLETKWLHCGRCVLLTGIPPVMDADNLQDMLEIHFQKGSNGGGEITDMLYNPLGQTAVALFERDL